MTMAIALRIVLILLGCYLLVMTLLSLARRKMSEYFCLVWALMSVLMVLTGFLLKPSSIERFISARGFVLIIIALFGVLWGLWFISTQVSILIRKNQELAIQISLLNQDIERLSTEIEEYKKTLQSRFQRNKIETNNR